MSTEVLIVSPKRSECQRNYILSLVLSTEVWIEVLYQNNGTIDMGTNTCIMVELMERIWMSEFWIAFDVTVVIGLIILIVADIINEY